MRMRRRRPLDAEILLQLGRVYEAGSQPRNAYEVYRSVLDFATAPPLDIYLLLIRTSAPLGRYAETAVFMDDYRRRGGDERRIESWKRLVQPVQVRCRVMGTSARSLHRGFAHSRLLSIVVSNVRLRISLLSP